MLGNMCYEDVSYMFRLCYSDESADIFLIFVLNKKEEEMLMKDFAAIDFETANGERSSVCSVGFVFVWVCVVLVFFFCL